MSIPQILLIIPLLSNLALENYSNICLALIRAITDCMWPRPQGCHVTEKWSIGCYLLLLPPAPTGGNSRLWKQEQEANLEGAGHCDHHPYSDQSLHVACASGGRCYHLLLNTVRITKCKSINRFNVVNITDIFFFFWLLLAIVKWYPIWRSCDSSCYNNAQPDSPVSLLVPGSLRAFQDSERRD